MLHSKKNYRNNSKNIDLENLQICLNSPIEFAKEKYYHRITNIELHTQQRVTCSKSTIERLKKGVKYVQS